VNIFQPKLRREKFDDDDDNDDDDNNNKIKQYTQTEKLQQIGQI
jgi:hypothetical protein